MTPSLYIHIPVCLKKCAYCDFFSVPVSSYPRYGETTRPLAPLVEALDREIASRKDALGITGWNTVYIGGGTPSLLSPDDIFTLASPLSAAGTEFTVEANPEDLTEEWLRACSDAGINRLSLGIQSMEDAVLAGIERRGSAASNRKAIDLVKKGWNGSLSLDLISGLPGQNRAMLERDIELLVSWNPDHISLYSLTIEEGTPLERMLSGKIPIPAGFSGVPDEDESADLWIAGRDLLEKHGYFQYEVSNFAHPGCESRHNMTYWNLDTYIGAGPGATGTVITGDTAYRTTDTRDIARWLEHPDASFSTELLSREDCINEVIIMGLRTLAGINRKKFEERFGNDILAMIPKAAGRWLRQGLLSADDLHVALTRDGLLFLNKFLVECMEETSDVSEKKRRSS